MMSRQLQLFFTALGFFTRIPCQAWILNDEKAYRDSIRYFPLIGIIVGMIAALGFVLSFNFFPQHLSVLFSMVLVLFLTGAMHEDGLADCVDGLGGGWNKEQMLNIMQDSRIGSYGVLALVMNVLIKFQSLSIIDSGILPYVMINAHAHSRWATMMLMATQDYVRASGKAKALSGRPSRNELFMAGICCLSVLFFLPLKFWWALLPLMLVWFGFSRLIFRQLGGYTGDCLGAMQQFCETFFYLGIVLCSFI
jgi:adenosylcobinamide-GDP ribazoletransferase